VVSLITSGREGALFSAPRDAEEWRKQLTSMLREGSTVVVIDNVNYRLDSGDLCKALTETTHGDRILGQSQTLNLPVRCAWIATGNNIQLGGDMPRRCYWVRMDAKCSKPFQRTGFKHKRLKEYVLKHRGELLAALLTLARAWFIAGRPEPNLTPVGSFEDWSVIIGGILQRAGVGGFLANSDQLYEQADIDTVHWEAFLKTLDTMFYSEPFTVSQVWEKMNDRTWNETTRRSELSAAPRACGPRCRTSSRRLWTARASSNSASASRWASGLAAATAIPRCVSSAMYTTAMAKWRGGKWC